MSKKLYIGDSVYVEQDRNGGGADFNNQQRRRADEYNCVGASCFGVSNSIYSYLE